MSLAVFFAEMKMTGMSRNSSFFFTARQSSNPSIQLIITSSRIRSGRSTCSVEISRSPLAAWATSYPSSSSAIFSISRVSRSSSTMMIFFLRAAIADLRRATSVPDLLVLSGERRRPIAFEQHLDLAFRFLQLRGGGAREPDALLEGGDRLLQRQPSPFEALHHLREALDQVLVLLRDGCRRGFGHGHSSNTAALRGKVYDSSSSATTRAESSPSWSRTRIRSPDPTCVELRSARPRA